MPSIPIPLGGRLPLLDRHTLIAQQQSLFEDTAYTVIPWAEASAFLAQDGEGRLIGPFNPDPLHPEPANSVIELQFAESAQSVLSERIRQVIILTVGSAGRADHELYAHSAVARRASLTDDIIDSLVAGETPIGLLPEELIAHRVARQLTLERRIDDNRYRITEGGLGRRGVLDIVFLVGIYQAVCGLLNAFAIPGPSPDQDHEGEAIGHRR